MATILITGAGGFVGGHVAARLAADGHRLRGLVRPTSDVSGLSGLPVDLRRGDVTDPASLRPAVEGADVVVHAAGLVSDWGPYRAFRAVNVIGTRNVAETALACGVRRFVHVSTAAAHGFGGFRNLDETAPLARTPFHYCETKKEAETWLLASSRAWRMEVVVLRPGNVFGPRDRTFTAPYLDALAAGRAGYIDGGRRWTCPTYVENLADAVAAACLEPSARGEAFLITDGLDIDWRTFTEALAAGIGARPPSLSIPFGPAYAAAVAMEAAWRSRGRRSPPILTRYRVSNGGRDYHFSIDKAARLLAYRPRVELEEAVRRTAEWYRRR